MSTQRLLVEGIDRVDTPVELQYIGTAALFRQQPTGKHTFRITVTDAMAALNKSIDDVEATALKYLRGGEVVGERDNPISIAAVITSEDVPNGKTDPQYRSVQITSDRDERPSYNVEVLTTVIDTLGLDEATARGERVDMWVGPQLIGFTTALSVEATSSAP